jgi:hypothetical protein
VGHNVAVPSVDVGDDVYIVEDRQGTMWRLQVKTTNATPKESQGERVVIGAYGLSRSQLRTPKRNELFFMFMVRWEGHWRFVLIPRVRLREIREAYEKVSPSGKSGSRPKSDDEASGDAMTLKITWKERSAEAWGVALDGYLGRWPEEFPENPDGPGARVAPAAQVSSAAVPSLGPGTPVEAPPADPPEDR